MNLCNNHHSGRVTTLQRLRSTILLPKLFRKTNLVLLEAANTFHVLILHLTTQKYTDIIVCKIFFQPLFVCLSYYLISSLFCIFFTQTSFKLLFFLWGHLHINTQYQLQQQYNNKQSLITVLLKIQDDSASKVLCFDGNLPANKSATLLWCVFLISIRGRCAGRRRCSGNYSDTNTGSLKDEEDSTSLATFTAFYYFSNSARLFSYP